MKKKIVILNINLTNPVINTLYLKNTPNYIAIEIK